MLKKIILVVSTLASVTGVMAVTSTPAEARPRMVCHRVWIHGHPVRRCRPIGPPPRHFDHGPGPRRY